MPTAQPDRRRIRAQVDAYFAKLPPESRRALKQIRAAIKAAAPKAVEHYGYGIPAFRLDDVGLVWYAGWKSHVSLYPISAGVKRAYAAQMKRYKLGKGTIQFPLSEKVPIALVTRIVKARVREVRAN
jgi:uncharacterized protein YdhG (YjbR/CyaY superfamily)